MKYLRILFVALPYLIYCYFAWILRYSWHKDRYPIEKRFKKVQKLIRIVTDSIGCNVICNDLSPLYNNPDKFLLVSNHQSFYDGVILIYIAKRPIAFVAKKEVKKFPIIGRIFGIIDGVFLDREDLKSQVKILMQVQDSLKNNKIDWCIFPEGTRIKNLDDILLPYHHGTFKIALKSQSNIAVFSMYGNVRALKFHKILRSKLPIQISFDRLFSYDEIKELKTIEIANKVEEITKQNIIKKRELDKKLF